MSRLSSFCMREELSILLDLFSFFILILIQSELFIQPERECIEVKESIQIKLLTTRMDGLTAFTPQWDDSVYGGKLEARIS